MFGRVLGGWIEPVLQPRLAMGMGVAALSFFMLRPGVRQLTPSDLDPVKVWTAAENRASRVWERGVKSYENLRLVYEIETRLNQWREEAPGRASRPPARIRGKPPRATTIERGNHRRILPRLRQGAGRSRRPQGAGSVVLQGARSAGRRCRASPYSAPPYSGAPQSGTPRGDISPGLAFGLGFIPGWARSTTGNTPRAWCMSP